MIRRRIFSLASLLSLLLCVASVVLWVRSFSIGDELFVAPGKQFMWGGFSALGEIELHCFAGWPDSQGVTYRTQRVVGTDTGMTPMWWPNASRRLRLPGIASFESGSESITLTQTGSGADWGHGPPIGTPELWVWSAPAFYFTLSIGYWVVALLLSLMPLRWFVWRMRVISRRRRGRCTECSYNLIGNTSGVCPECGRKISAEVGV